MAGKGVDDRRVGQYLANGNVLFTDNVCNLNLIETGVGFALSSVMVLTLDDIGFANNQSDCDLLDDYVILNTLLFGISLRASANRFKEGLFNCVYSAMTIGIMNLIADNQATHCLLVIPVVPALTVERDNKAMADWLAGVVPQFAKTFPWWVCRQNGDQLTTAGFKMGSYYVKPN
jgi:hypothetical protein